MDTNSRIRRAHINDALDIAAFVDIAGHGVDLDQWMTARDGDELVFSAARRLVTEDLSLPYHYSRAHIVEVGGRVAGGLIGGLIAKEEAAQEGDPAHVEPLIALENRVPGYWNIFAIAVYPEFRGRGLASTLLDYADHLALQIGARGLSIVAEDTNARARALYEKRGFKIEASLPWIAFGGRVGPSQWLMLTKPLVDRANSGS
ncbi:MAG: GNAT family N-acetyltransferase [Hyphomicrobium sp.]|uniref:GNAT family N-acetyltransferase n=1 Tax=Hyphomicrobium sp. TaxID=82 RepID=UPI0039E34855